MFANSKLRLEIAKASVTHVVTKTNKRQETKRLELEKKLTDIKNRTAAVV